MTPSALPEQLIPMVIVERPKKNTSMLRGRLVLVVRRLRRGKEDLEEVDASEEFVYIANPPDLPSRGHTWRRKQRVEMDRSIKARIAHQLFRLRCWIHETASRLNCMAEENELECVPVDDLLEIHYSNYRVRELNEEAQRRREAMENAKNEDKEGLI
ncbi:hypothetical protein PRIPAC_96615 [Pristionchus pacificus]|uniref:Uncharacterized protein n=1 Tax=Pristionchus pacificus TaxID=54126 RepID=A0A2A6CTS9_PRIPA|nr:hypothetical protein PRIPAC_96615 [Pristionchus pacificus]|eukprot:PDM81634.1 hypothetical protein PRIPAC_30615 [Pristionchus pacificus]